MAPNYCCPCDHGMALPHITPPFSLSLSLSHTHAHTHTHTHTHTPLTPCACLQLESTLIQADRADSHPGGGGILEGLLTCPPPGDLVGSGRKTTWCEEILAQVKEL